MWTKKVPHFYKKAKKNSSLNAHKVFSQFWHIFKAENSVDVINKVVQLFKTRRCTTHTLNLVKIEIFTLSCHEMRPASQKWQLIFYYIERVKCAIDASWRVEQHCQWRQHYFLLWKCVKIEKTPYASLNWPFLNLFCAHNGRKILSNVLPYISNA